MDFARRIDPLLLRGLCTIAIVIAVPFVLGLQGAGWSQYSDALLIVHSPLALGGAVTMLDARLLRRRTLAGRITATIGSALALIAAGGLAVAWIGLDQYLMGFVCLGNAVFDSAAMPLAWRGRAFTGSRNGAAPARSAAPLTQPSCLEYRWRLSVLCIAGSPRHASAMRNPIFVIVLLVLFGLVPIGAWLAMAASLEPVGLGRNIGKAILVVLAPLGFAGILMILGAVMFNRTRRAGRIFATVGASIIVVGVGFLAALWLERAGRCVDGASFCTDLLVEGGGGLLYAIAHMALIALVWRARRDESSSA